LDALTSSCQARLQTFFETTNYLAQDKTKELNYNSLMSTESSESSLTSARLLPPSPSTSSPLSSPPPRSSRGDSAPHKAINQTSAATGIETAEMAPLDAPPLSTESNLLEELNSSDRYNFKCYGLYQIMLRTGWIFKTESIIMPAVLDVIGGSGWLRGCLPMLNRFGQSVPPLLVSDHVRNSSLKKVGLAGSTAIMGCCFLFLSLIWAMTDGAKSAWLPLVFLGIYGVFFCATGINQLQLVTITGKLIRVDYRGRVGMVAVLLGSILACTAAWFLLRMWLPNQAGAGAKGNFTAIFGFTGAIFMLASVLALGFREKPDQEKFRRRNGWQLFRSSLATIREDRNFLRLTLIGALFGMCLTLFPHYQSLARERLSLGLSSLIPWVIAQNMGAAAFSIPAGWLADRFGNRIVLQFIMLILCVPPVLAIYASGMERAGTLWFNVVFFLVGLTPVTFRVLNNYTLEVTSNSEHPRYLSTLGLMMAGPAILTSAFFGALVDWISFEFVFGVVVICLLIGWGLTFTLSEPRKSLQLVDGSLRINTR
jgi:MFS-type transporter involved in bile tolerance (Atg22 family)